MYFDGVKPHSSGYWWAAFVVCIYTRSRLVGHRADVNTDLLETLVATGFVDQTWSPGIINTTRSFSAPRELKIKNYITTHD